MLLEANAAKTVDFDKLTAFDKARVPLSFSVDRNDPRYFTDWKQWQNESVGVAVGARTVDVRADVFKHAAHHVPFNEAAYTFITPRSQGENPVYTPTPDTLPKPMSPAMAIAAGMGIMGDLALGVMAAKSKNRAAIASWLMLQAPIVNGCQTVMATPSAEVTQAPAEVIKTPSPSAVETTTPQPQVSTENAPGGPLEPTAVPSSSWPDVGMFPQTLPNREVIPQGEIKAENVLDQFGDIDYTLRYYGKSADLGFVETTNGAYQWAIQATTNGGKSALWPENAEGQLFSHPSTANDQDVSAATPVMGYETITPTGIGDDYTLALESANGVFTYVARSTKDGSILASYFVAPNLQGEWRLPAAEVAKFSIDSLGLTPDVAAALKKHSGLEASIVAEADGFTTQITYWDANHNLVTEKVNVDPSGLTENLTSKNKFGKTPTMSTVDGLTLIWSQEHKAWFKQFEVSSDINAPVFVPLEYRDVLIRDILLHDELNQPFSNAAIERWKTSPGLTMGFQYLDVNVNTGTSTKFGYLENSSAVTWSGLNKDNSPIQALDAWYYTVLPDGTKFQFFPTKWLDPLVPRSPNPDEWKIILVASGDEIMGDAANRATFDKLWENAANMDSKLEILPIFKIEDGFFDDTNGLITFAQAQPSLAKLLKLNGNDMGELPNPGHDGNPYNYTFGFHFPNLSATNPNIVVGIGQDDPKYVNGFFPADIQTIIFPSLIVQH